MTMEVTPRNRNRTRVLAVKVMMVVESQVVAVDTSGSAVLSSKQPSGGHGEDLLFRSSHNNVVPV